MDNTETMRCVFNSLHARWGVEKNSFTFRVKIQTGLHTRTRAACLVRAARKGRGVEKYAAKWEAAAHESFQNCQPPCRVMRCYARATFWHYILQPPPRPLVMREEEVLTVGFRTFAFSTYTYIIYTGGVCTYAHTHASTQTHTAVFAMYGGEVVDCFVLGLASSINPN